MPVTNPILIGVAGGSGSGKTFLAYGTRDAIGPEHVAVVPMDQYFRTMSEDMDPSLVNFDHPAHLDLDLLVAHLKKIKSGETVFAPHYDFATMIQEPEAVEIVPRGVVIVEGLFVLAPPVVNELDITCFLDVDPDQRLLGRIMRDIAEREATIHDVIHRYQRFIRPSYHVFVGPTKQNADIIVDFTYRRRFFTQLLIGLIRSYVENRHDLQDIIAAVRDETYRVGIRPEEGAMPAIPNILDLAKSYPASICPPVERVE